MIQPEELRDTDMLETMSPARPSTLNAADAVRDSARDSASSETDAGLDDPAIEETDVIELEADSGTEFLDPESQFVKATEPRTREIPITDLEEEFEEDLVHSPELADMSTPGEVDIEDLNEDALDDALPPDARLDRIEE